MKAAIFDLDGTLLNSSSNIIACIQEVRIENSLPIATEDFLISKIGLAAQELFSDLTHLPIDFHKLVGEFRSKLSKKKFFDSDLYEGVPELLTSLKREGMLIGIATNKPSDLAIKCLTDSGIIYLINEVVGGEIYAVKPSPEIINACLENLGVKASEAVMVGDRIEDVKAANAAGVRAIGVSQTHHTVSELGNSGSFVTLNSILELVQLLKKREWSFANL